MTQAIRSADETQIRALIDGRVKALHDKNVDAGMAAYAPDPLVYNLAPPLSNRGADALRRGMEAWYPTFKGAIGYEVHDLDIAIGGDLAYSTSFNRITGSRTDGEETNVWVRSTVCYRKMNGRWMVAHEHASVPFYMDGSLKAAIDLEP